MIFVPTLAGEELAMDRDLCLKNARICRLMAYRAIDDDQRETYVRLAQTWDGQANQFIDPDVEMDSD